MKPTFASLLLLLVVMPARADEVHDLLDKLQKEITETVNAHQGDRKGRYPMEQLTSDMAALNKDFARDTFNPGDAKGVLERLSRSKATAEAKQIAARLAELLPDVAAARAKDFASRLDETLKRVGDACLAAKKDSDLEPALAEVDALKLPSHSSDNGRSSARLETARRFLLRWQEYLRQLAADYEQPANGILHDLAENPGSYPLLTRPQILSKLSNEPKPEPVETILASIKNLDDLSQAIEKIGQTNQRRRSIDPGAYETTGTLEVLKQIYKAHTAAKAGLYQNALESATQIYDRTAGLMSAQPIRFKTMLLLEILPAYLDLPEGTRPHEGENPGQFLLRVADEAVAKGEWEKVQRVLDAYRLSAFGMRAPSWLQGEITGCNAYLAAQKLENAGDFRRATAEYEKVLLQPGKRLPIKEATARLAAIKKEHAAEFEEGSKEGATNAKRS